MTTTDPDNNLHSSVAPSNVVALRDDSMMAFDPRDVEQRRLVRELVLKGQEASEDEFLLFLHVAAHSGLDPLRKQIYGIRRQGKLTIQTGIDGYRAIAARTGLHAGTEDPTYRGHPRGGEADYPGEATVVVYKIVAGLRVPFTATARWDEYKPPSANNQDSMWKAKPYLMLGKCAEALALRRAFPEELSGIEAEEASSYVPSGAVVGAGVEGVTVERTKSRDEVLRDRFDALPVASKVKYTAWLREQDVPKPGERSDDDLDRLEAKLDEMVRDDDEVAVSNPMPAVEGETCAHCDAAAVANGLCGEHALPPDVDEAEIVS
jgi:phage recombination protein Bet